MYVLCVLGSAKSMSEEEVFCRSGAETHFLYNISFNKQLIQRQMYRSCGAIK